MLQHYTCGCYGRENNSPRARVHEFIRVAEVRNRPVEEVRGKCPVHSK